MNDKQMVRDRVNYIDYTKALGMLTVMWGHIALGFSATFVYTFHMPLFFFLSGMVFEKEKYPEFKLFVKRRVQTLLIPYVIYSFATWIVWAAYSYFLHVPVESYWMPLLQTFIAQGSGGFLVHNVPLWFVTCLFVIEMVYYFLSRCNDAVNVTVSIFLAALGYFLINKVAFFDFTLLPWSIEVAMLAMFFYSLGNLFVKHIGHEKFKYVVLGNNVISIIVIIALLAVCYWGGVKNGRLSMGHSYIGNPVIFYPVAIAGTLAMLITSMLFSDWLKRAKVNNAITWFGKNSFIAMAIHNPIKGFVVVAVAYLMGISINKVGSNDLYVLLCWFITLIITVSLMLIILRLKKKVKK